ncbi:MAG: PspC domain-containing protein [Helcococcus sp.]|nr:PspC domain-containing protein [Helcococcus sp.]
MDKKLKKSSKNKLIAGVCGGIAEYLNIDVTLVRLIWTMLGFFFGGGLILYILFALIMPSDYTAY